VIALFFVFVQVMFFKRFLAKKDGKEVHGQDEWAFTSLSPTRHTPNMPCIV